MAGPSRNSYGNENRGQRARPLAAAGRCPTFATMAVFTAVFGDGAHMVPMYVLMSGFNLAPWLEVFVSRSR